MGVMPEFDSMAVVNVIAGLEAIVGKTIADDEITTEMFESVGSLAHFIETYQA
jgi:acyl carrier protein